MLKPDEEHPLVGPDYVQTMTDKQFNDLDKKISKILDFVEKIERRIDKINPHLSREELYKVAKQRREIKNHGDPNFRKTI